MPSSDFSFSTDDFRGQARLFPLPNLVVFPHIMQPLRIFEPRYRDMLEEALASDGLIAMVLLAPDWEKDYDGRPRCHDVACLCRVATYHRQDDGSYNVLLIGLRRIELVEELPPNKSFREARVRVVDDAYDNQKFDGRSQLQQDLLAAFKHMLPQLPEAQEQLDQLLGSEIPLGMLTDIVSYTLDLNVALKQQLLAESDVDRRAALLLKLLRQPDAAPQTPPRNFPPPFSAN